MTEFRNLLAQSPTPIVRILSAALITWVLANVIIVAYTRSLPLSFQVWDVGDWLISYQGGFVRRGLIGSLLLPITNMTGLRPEFLVFLVKLSAYLVIYLFALTLMLRDASLKVAHLALLLSPAFLLFPPYGEFMSRKEILLLATACLICMGARPLRAPGYVLLATVFLVLTFIHEGHLFFLPLLILVVVAAHPHRHWELRRLVLTLVPSAALFLWFAQMGPASDETIHEIARAIDPVHVEEWRRGAIRALRRAAGGEFERIQNLRAAFFAREGIAGVLFALVPAVLSFVVVALCATVDGPGFFRSPAWRRIWPWLALTLLAQLPLFLLSRDWGRWMFVNTSLLSLSLLAYRWQDREAPRGRGGRWLFLEPRASAAPLTKTAAQVAVLAVLVGTWGMRHCCDFDLWSGPSARVFRATLQELRALAPSVRTFTPLQE